MTLIDPYKIPRTPSSWQRDIAEDGVQGMGLEAREQSIVRFTGTPVRFPRGKPAGVEIRRVERRKVYTLAGACQHGRLRHLFCDLDISALYPLPRIPSCLPGQSLSSLRRPAATPALSAVYVCLREKERERERDPSMPFEYLVHRASRPHASRPTLHCQPPLLLTNSCREPRDLGLSIFLLVRGQGAFLMRRRVGHLVRDECGLDLR